MIFAMEAGAAPTPRTGAVAFLPRPTGEKLRVHFLPWALAAAFFSVYASYSFSRYTQYLTAGYDLGIFDQAIRHYAKFGVPFVPLKGPDYNILGDHFHPILAILAPLYWVWDDPRALLAAQAALIASSIPVVYRFAQRHLGRPVLSGVLATGYGLGWPLQGMLDFDFHEVAFAVPLLAWSIDALDRRSDRQLFLSAGLLLLTREDMGVVVLFLGLVRAARAPRRTGIVLSLLGVAVYFFATALVLPHFAPNGKFAYWSYDALGPDVPSAVRTIVFHPWQTTRLFFTPWVKSHTLLWLFGPLLFLCLRSPYVVVAAPLLAGRFFSSRDHLWTTEFHYSAALWPILFLAAIDGARRTRLTEKRVPMAAVAVVLAGVQVIGTFSHAGLWPFHRLLTGAAFHTTEHMRDQAALTAAIPAHTCVEVDDRLAPHLTHANRVSLPTLLGQPPDFIGLDLAQHEVSYQLPAPDEILKQASAQGYTTVFERGSLVLLQRPDYRGPTASCQP